mgnify:CR=1 FL=1|jgi:hypothetical protein
MTTYNFPDHIGGDTFKAREITFGFDLTGAKIDMQFKSIKGGGVAFSWSTVDDTFSITDPVNGVILMKSRILDERKDGYIYDLQIVNSNQDVQTYFGGRINITQGITK